jgi:ABC-2 type transport system permease protein
MRSFFRHFVAQLTALVATRKLRLLLAIFVGACVLTGEIYRERVLRELPIAVVDQDRSRLSRTIRLDLEATPELRVVPEVPRSVDEAHAMLVDGRIAGVVVLPATLSADLKHGRAAQVLLATDMSNLVVGRTAYRAIAKVLGTVSAGVELSYLQKTGVPSRQALARVVPVASDERLTFNPAGSYSTYMLPSTAFFFLNLVLTVLMGFLYLPPTAAGSAGERVARAAAFWFAGLLGGLGLAYGLLPLQGVVSHSGVLVLLATLAVYVVAALLLPAALQALLPSAGLAFQLSLLLGVLALMISGATFPVDALPEAFQRLSAALPFTPFSRALRLYFNQRLSLGEVSECLVQLLAQALAFAALIAAGRLARRYAPLAHRRAA